MKKNQDNPLLDRKGLPLFDELKPEHVVPAMKVVLNQLHRRLMALEEAIPADPEELLTELGEIEYELHRSWGPVNHMLGVCNSPEWRESHQAVLPRVVDFGLRMQQSEPVFRALQEMRDGALQEGQTPEIKRLVAKRILASHNAGLGLRGHAREKFNEIEYELSQLATDFSNNVLDAFRTYGMELTTPAEIAGLPASLLALAAENYNREHSESTVRATPEEGPWRITLEAPCFIPFMQNSKKRKLREQLYLARITSASEGAFDNTPLIQRILRLRAVKAELLGYQSFATLSLSEKMAEDPRAVTGLLEELRVAAWEIAAHELRELESIAPRHEIDGPIHPWDVHFLAERLREWKFHFTDEELRAYFPLPRVLEGLFELTEHLFGITVTPHNDPIPTWHPDVRYYRLGDAEGNPVAFFYLDPYSRPSEKRGGAWMDECLLRRKTASGIESPVAYLNLNCSLPLNNRPSLLTFQEVTTLFHEFGHGLQHMLTRVDHLAVTGINGIEWDAVELASQFMENWCYHRPTVRRMSSHVETGEPLPDSLFNKIELARTFRTGSDMLRQIKFGLLDMELHHHYDPNGDETVFEVEKRIDRKTSHLPSLPEDRFLCTFSHIFAGGYAAGYYSYKWAEVMAADAFSAFEEVGFTNRQEIEETGQRFRETVLALGGSLDPLEVFKRFRGREPKTGALLRQSGLR